jgi:transmembrane sensor
MSQGVMGNVGNPPDNRQSQPADPERLQREAMAWLSLLSSGTATQADAEELKAWCRQDPSHAGAYARAARVWDRLGTVAAQAERPQIARPAASSTPVLVRRAFLGGAIAASVTGATYVAVHPPLGLWPSLAELRADVRTAPGERRRLDLAEGVSVDLNTRSSLALGAGHDAGIELIRGEAIIAAAPNADKSCTVVAGGGRIVAARAKFDVRHDGDDRVVVICLDGRVKVEHVAQAVVLETNQKVIYDRFGIGETERVDPVTATAWQEGRLVFRKAALSDVISEVNRYRSGRIILMNRHLGERLIDASFQLNRLENVLVYLEQAFAVAVRQLPGGLVLVG